MVPKLHRRLLFIPLASPLTVLRVIFVKEGDSALRHLGEHILAHQCLNNSGETLFSLIGSKGGLFQAWTNSQAVVFSATFPSTENENLIPTFLSHLLEFKFEALSKQQLEEHKNALRYERSDLASPYFALREQLEALRYDNDWIPILPTETMLQNYTLNKVCQFGHHFFRKDAALVIIASDHFPSTGQHLVSNSPELPLRRGKPRSINDFKAVYQETADTTNHLMVSLPGPNPQSSLHDNWIMDLLLNLIGGNVNSIFIDTALQRFTYPRTAIVYQKLIREGFGLVSLSLPGETDPMPTFKQVLATVSSLVNKYGVDTKLFDRVKRIIGNRAVLFRDNIEHQVDWYQDLWLNNQALVGPEEYRDFMLGLSKKELEVFIEKYKLGDRVQFGITPACVDEAKIKDLIKLFP